MNELVEALWLCQNQPETFVFLSLLQPGSKKMEHKGSSWHENCFACNRCQQPIGTRSFVQKDSSNYCLPCYEKQYAQKCCYCKMVRGQTVQVDQPRSETRPCASTQRSESWRAAEAAEESTDVEPQWMVTAAHCWTLRPASVAQVSKQQKGTSRSETIWTGRLIWVVKLASSQSLLERRHS